MFLLSGPCNSINLFFIKIFSEQRTNEVFYCSEVKAELQGDDLNENDYGFLSGTIINSVI